MYDGGGGIFGGRGEFPRDLLSVSTTDELEVQEVPPPGWRFSALRSAPTTKTPSTRIGGGGRGSSKSSPPLTPIGGGGGGQDNSGDTGSVGRDCTSVVGRWWRGSGGEMCAIEMAGTGSAFAFVFSAVASMASRSTSCFLLFSRSSMAFLNIPLNMSLTLTVPSTSVTLSFPTKSTFCKVCLPLRSSENSFETTLS